MILTLECPDIKEPAIFTDWFSKSDVLQFEKMYGQIFLYLLLLLLKHAVS